MFTKDLRRATPDVLLVETELLAALDNEELVLHYQPVIDLRSGLPRAVEALVRWNHPTQGLIQPLEFIPIAEETGLIVQLGRRVLEEACAQAAEWQRRFGVPLQMFINASGHQIANPCFPAEVAEIERTGGEIDAISERGSMK